MVVFSCAFSGDGDWLAAGDDAGRLRVWHAPNVMRTIDRGGEGSDLAPLAAAAADTNCGRVYALAFTGDGVLLTGSDVDTAVWTVVDGVLQRQRSLRTPETRTSDAAVLPPSETNALAVDAHNCQHVFAGGGDACVYQWDVEAGQIVARFAGHTDYVHCLAASADGALVSGSEDGTVRLWDARSRSCVAVLDPSTGEAVAKRHAANSRAFVGAVAANSTWLACGGGDCLVTYWHLPSRAVVHAMPTAGAVHALALLGDAVVSGGAEPWLYSWASCGRLRGRVALTSASVFGMAVNRGAAARPALAVCGSADAVELLVDPLLPSTRLPFK